MDCIKLTIVALLLSVSAQAQTFAEWFSQKKTQKKYLLQQIAALHVYSGYLKTGYSIAKSGLGSIGNYLGDEYGLHGDYYNRLKIVNSAVKNNPQVNDILHWQNDILKQTTAIKNQSGLKHQEYAYIVKVCSALLTDCDARMNELQTIVSDNKAEMSDEQRLRQIARLHQAMQDNYRFAASFRNQLQLYIRNKQQEEKDNNILKQLYANR
jgi:hypothetical protein